MNISLLRIKPLIRELVGCRRALERIADCYEAELAERQVYIREPITVPDEKNTTLAYTDEELDAAQELVDMERRRRGELVEES